MNKSAKKSYTGIDCQSCTNDIILLIKRNISSLVSAGFFSIFVAFFITVIKCSDCFPFTHLSRFHAK